MVACRVSGKGLKLVACRTSTIPPGATAINPSGPAHAVRLDGIEPRKTALVGLVSCIVTGSSSFFDDQRETVNELP